jgi:Glycoside Hydrolase Family 113
MRRPAVLLLLAAVTALAACGHPLVPPSALRPARTPQQSATRLPFPLSSPAPAASTAATALGAGSQAPVLGVDLYALSNYPPAVAAADGRRTLSYIRHVLKANAVGIVWDYFATGPQSDAVQRTSNTLSARNVGILTRIAQQDHLRVEYRPLIFVHGVADSWEGKIRPRHPAAWFQSYYQAELPYLKMAQQHHVSEFVTATEMNELNSSPLWPAFFARVSRVYHGVVSYSAWDKNYVGAPLLPVRYLGMDMYAQMHLPGTATASQVAAAWADYFRSVPASVLQRTAIDETGIAARAGGYHRPEALGAPGALDEQVQANWFRAACTTVRHLHMRGVFFWKVDLTDYPATPATSLSTFEGRPGAAAIGACARTLSGG